MVKYALRVRSSHKQRTSEKKRGQLLYDKVYQKKVRGENGDAEIQVGPEFQAVVPKGLHNPRGKPFKLDCIGKPQWIANAVSEEDLNIYLQLACARLHFGLKISKNTDYNLSTESE